MNHYAVFMTNGQGIRISTDTAIENETNRIVFVDETGNTHFIPVSQICDIIKVTEENYQAALASEQQPNQTQ